MRYCSRWRIISLLCLLAKCTFSTLATPDDAAGGDDGDGGSESDDFVGLTPRSGDSEAPSANASVYSELTAQAGVGSEEGNRLLEKVETGLKAIYNTAIICLAKDDCLKLNPDLNTLMRTSTDNDKLLIAWKRWHDATGRKMKYIYPENVKLLNKKFIMRGFLDAGEGWRANHESPSLEENVSRLLAQLRPLYEQLHAFVRRHLMDQFGQDNFPASGLIPAHLLGTMMADQWGSIGEKFLPFTGKKATDLTGELMKQNYTISDIIRTAEDFYTSLGLKPMTKYYWNRSETSNQSNEHSFGCDPSVNRRMTRNDLSACEAVNKDTFFNIHRDMGQIKYFVQDISPSKSIQSTSNQALQEIVGDVVELLVHTPEHLHRVGLWNEGLHNNESDINNLMDTALKKLAFIPYGFLVDQWRWSVFRGDTESLEYNKYWWQLRCRHQGVAPPSPRLDSDFDPGADYYVAANKDYTGNVVRHIVQFQIYRAACDAAGYKGPLHRCDIFGSTAAGDKLREIMHAISTGNWSDVLLVATPEGRMDTSAMLEYFQPLHQFLKKTNGNDYGWDPKCPTFDPDDDVDKGREFNQTEVEEAERFLQDYELGATSRGHLSSLASWNLKTNLTSYNQEVKVNVSLQNKEFYMEKAVQGREFKISKLPRELAIQIKEIAHKSVDAQKNQTKLKQAATIESDMEKVFSTAKVCPTHDKCLSLEPDIINIFAKSRDFDELLQVWSQWYEVSGTQIKDMFSELVDLNNEAARLAGRNNTKETWLAGYNLQTFEDDIATLFAQIHPLYEQLHAFVRRRLKARYGADRFPSSGQIPAHLLGNVWAQQWDNIMSEILPFPNRQFTNITKEMVKQNYTVERMIRLAESFYASLGFQNMTSTFWNKSEFVKPKDGRAFNCHATAHNMIAHGDFRLSMCAEVNKDFLVTIHHEMGHVQYYMEYQHLPILFRTGANDAFHEAIGDVMALSVQTPEHLFKINLSDTVSADNESDINFLMSMALNKVAFLPFGYLVDYWRWSVFTGETTPADYNKRWWDLRCRYQGVSPPVQREARHFDPGAKYHVARNIAYIRYFISFIIQFQFHQAACDAAGYEGPLHRCDIYGSKAAGDKIRKMLRMGSSRHWFLAMKALTGQKKMDATPMLKYFKPLMDYLRSENGNDYGWAPQCSGPQYK